MTNAILAALEDKSALPCSDLYADLVIKQKPGGGASLLFFSLARQAFQPVLPRKERGSFSLSVVLLHIISLPTKRYPSVSPIRRYVAEFPSQCALMHVYHLAT